MPPRLTQKEIAQALGISPATVSYVMSGRAEENRVSDETARRVLDYARSRGYVPNMLARSLRRKRTGIVGISLYGFVLGWAHRIEEGVREGLEGTGVAVMYAPSRANPQSERQQLDWMLQHQIDGVIVCVAMQDNRDYYADLQRRGLPLVFLGDIPTGMSQESSYVIWDAPAALGEMLSRLIATGRRNIVWAASAHREVMSLARYAAFRETLQRHDIALQERRHLRLDYGGVTDQLQTFKLRDWVREQIVDSNDPPEAIVCLDDSMAYGVIAELDRVGVRVPEDVVVTGVGNLPLPGTVYDRILTVREPCEELGREATRALLALMDNPDQPSITNVLKSVVVVDRPGLLANDQHPSLLGVPRHLTTLESTLERNLVS